MTFRTLILRSLRYHWRAHLGVVLGAAVGSAALIGALVVGDSVRESVRERALERVGSIRYALSLPDRFVTTELADTFSGNSPRSADPASGTHVFIPTADALVLPAVVSRQDGSSRANSVNLIGISRRGPGGASGTNRLNLWSFGRTAAPSEIRPDEVWLNESLAAQLGAANGETLLFRVHKPSALSRDAPITPTSDSSVALRLRLAGIRTADGMGNFGLRASQAPPRNAFMGMAALGNAAGLSNKANLLLSSVDSADPLQRVLNKSLGIEDFEASLRLRSNSVELTSSRIFLEPPIVNAAYSISNNFDDLQRQSVSLAKAEAAFSAILTYLVTQFRFSTNSTPYSMVTAAGPPWTPAGLRDDEIVVNQWLADDLQVKPGDRIELSYFLPESGARLVEVTNRFRVHSVVPMTMPWADRTLMPEFPGIEKAERTQDWDAGFPLTLKIRDKDEAYWKQWRGTPKAFVTLTAGQKMWGNRFGNLTAIRWPVPTNALGLAVLSAPPDAATTNGAVRTPRPTSAAEQFRRIIERNLLANLDPAEFGLRFEPVREQALKAAEESQDFGGLFLGFSFFLIAAALILMALLFQFGVEQRMTEIGTLLALGFTPHQVRRLFLLEGTALGALGGALGVAGGLGYAWLMIRGLTTIWREAVASSALDFHVTLQTLLLGGVASVLVSAAVIGLTLRKQARQPARDLLAGEITDPTRRRSERRRPSSSLSLRESKLGARAARPPGVGQAIGLALTNAATVAWSALVLAALALAWVVARGETSNASVFFVAGSLLLVAGIGFTALLFRRAERAHGHLTLTLLGWRGTIRRRNRSLAVVGLLACGSFLIVAIGAFKLDANADALRRSSGTGGFALIGESTLPIVKDLNTAAGREFFGLDAATLTNVSFVPMRLREGDEASCLNLNRAQRPRLLGVKPELLAQRDVFTFAKVAKGLDLKRGWRLLGTPGRVDENTVEPGSRKTQPPSPDGRQEVAAIGDLNSILWAMGKQVGDTIDYVDERGQPFKVRLVGGVANSILQGNLLIDEAEFLQRFPGEAGYRMFLIDVPSNRLAEVSVELSRALETVGLEITPATRRLAQFNAVQNTYLNTFQVLGGLGLLLGAAGLGVVVLRNVLERRSELALLQAVGFRRRRLHALVLGEHSALLLLGLGAGMVSALVAVWPALRSPAAQLPFASLSATLLGVLAVGLLATWLATRWAVRGQLLDALRNE